MFAMVTWSHAGEPAREAPPPEALELFERMQALPGNNYAPSAILLIGAESAVVRSLDQFTETGYSVHVRMDGRLLTNISETLSAEEYPTFAFLNQERILRDPSASRPRLEAALATLAAMEKEVGREGYSSTVRTLLERLSLEEALNRLGWSGYGGELIPLREKKDLLAREEAERAAAEASREAASRERQAKAHREYLEKVSAEQQRKLVREARTLYREARFTPDPYARFELLKRLDAGLEQHALDLPEVRAGAAELYASTAGEIRVLEKEKVSLEVQERIRKATEKLMEAEYANLRAERRNLEEERELLERRRRLLAEAEEDFERDRWRWILRTYRDRERP